MSIVIIQSAILLPEGPLVAEDGFWEVKGGVHYLIRYQGMFLWLSVKVKALIFGCWTLLSS